jgi:multidrug resistance efflux pump
MITRKKAYHGGLLSVLVISGLVVAFVLAAQPRDSTGNGEVTGLASTEEQPSAEGDQIRVKTIRPKHDPAFEFSAEAQAYVEAYYRAGLEARVAGPVKFIEKDINDPVTAGEMLVEIDVPDRVQEVLRKQAIIIQKEKELKLAEETVEIAKATVASAQVNIKSKDLLVNLAEEERLYRQKEFSRFKTLVKEQGATPDIVDEKENYYRVAVVSVESAREAVVKAKSDLEEAKAKLAASRAEVELRRALIGVAEQDRDEAQALADYAKITAPFDGVITRRNVGPGSFVQNANSGHGEPLLIVERTDIVTVYTKLPDNFAPYVTTDTEATIEMSELPGQVIHGKVTRRAPSLQSRENDRTMRVEMDLYNGTAEEYQRFLAKEKAINYADLKSRKLPLLPTITGKHLAAQPHHLLPGMYGKMRLVFRKLPNAFLLPSSALVSQGGTLYIFELKNGTAHLVPVEVEMDGGKVVSVRVIEKIGNEEIKRELTGNEEIIISNQGELSDGQAVAATRTDW